MRQKSFLAILLLFFFTTSLWASDTSVNGIWYDFNNSTRTATVTYRGLRYDSYANEYTGDVTIPESVTYDGQTYSVTSIGNAAFGGCSSLTSVTIPNSVTSIGGSAFYNCSSLTSIDIPNSVTSIGYAAFSNCSSLTSVTIGNSVTSIGGSAFYNCSSLTSATIPNSVTSIEESAFYGCSSLTSVTIGNSVTSIGEGTFEGCSSLSSIDIPNSVTSIGYQAFRYCSSLTSVTIPNSVTSIGGSAFYGCSSLTSVTIGNSVTSIGGSAFYNCSSLTSVTIPNSVTSIGDYAFKGCSSLTSVVWNAKNCADFTSSNTPFYSSSSQITSFVFGDEVEHVPAYLCSGMKNMASVTVPNSVKSIGGSAFYGCSSLTSVTIPNSVTSIGYDAFAACSSLTSVVWNAKNCADFTSSNIPFYSLSSQITSFVFGDEVEYVPAYLCYGMNNLTSITIPNSVTSIGDSAFYGCSSLSSVVWNAKNYADFTYDNTPFYYYDSYYSSYKYDLRSQITSFVFGDEVEHVPAYLCYGMNNLTSITIPNSVTSIGNYTFQGCSSLTSVLCEGSTPATLGTKAFYYNTSSSLKIIVPCGTIDAYKNEWSNYSSRIYYVAAIVKTESADSKAGSVSVPTACDSTITATANYGYQFAQWDDGNTDNPRTIDPMEEVTYTAEFAFVKSGTCGDNNQLAWRYDDESKTLTISGNGTLNSNYTYGAEAPSQAEQLIIEDGVTSIGSSAFRDCSSLTSVTIPNSVTSIGDGAFAGCSSLTSPVYNEHVFACMPTSYSGDYSIQEGIESIAGGAFYNCRSLTSIDIPNSVTSIGYAAFYECSSLTSATIGNSVTSIGVWAFGYCSSLTSIDIPNSVTSIGERAFYNCSSLTSVVWNAKNYADFTSSNTPFYSSSSQITSFVFGNEVERIPAYLCYGLSGITEIVIPNSVKSIGEYAFYNCSGLPSVNIPYGATSIERYTFYGCSNLTSITIPNSVTSIGQYAFAGLNNRKFNTLVLPNTIISIGAHAFDGALYLQTIHFGSVLEEIGDYAFNGCTRVKEMTCLAEITPNVGVDGLASISDLATLNVPNDYLFEYQLDNNWNRFQLKAIGATEATVTDNDVKVEADDNTATITWPTDDSADSYTIEITKDGVVFCSLTFNAAGQLTNIAFAPSRSGQALAPTATKVANGLQFTVTGLNSGTSYGYLVEAKSGSTTVASYTGEFETTGAPAVGTAIEPVGSSDMLGGSQKILRDGQLLIEHNGKTYNALGARVK